MPVFPPNIPVKDTCIQVAEEATASCTTSILVKPRKFSEGIAQLLEMLVGLRRRTKLFVLHGMGKHLSWICRLNFLFSANVPCTGTTNAMPETLTQTEVKWATKTRQMKTTNHSSQKSVHVVDGHK